MFVYPKYNSSLNLDAARCAKNKVVNQSALLNCQKSAFWLENWTFVLHVWKENRACSSYDFKPFVVQKKNLIHFLKHFIICIALIK